MLMNLFFLTPASISYLNQFLLALLLTAFLLLRVFVLRKLRSSKLTNLLILFLASLTLFSLLLFLESSFLPSERLYPVYLQNTALGFILTTIIQFASNFPSPNPKFKIERWLALILTSAYTLWEAGIAIWRFDLLSRGQVVFRPDYLDYAPALGFIWVVFVFLRGWIQNWYVSVNRRFALIFTIPLTLAVINLLRTFYLLSASLYYISMSVGILFTMFFFVLNYLSSQPEATTFSTKFSGAIISSSLAVLGVIPWVMAPAYAARYAPNLIDHRSIQFSPNASGGYTAAEIPFTFENDFGRKLNLTESILIHPTEGVDFTFPFFGRDYQKIYISNDGAITIGSDPNYKDYQYHFTQSPAIFPLFMDLHPEQSMSGGVYLKQSIERLVVTFDHVQSYKHSNEVYTFQITLYTDGKFKITYNGLPESFSYAPNDRPDAAPWAIGVNRGQVPAQQVIFRKLPIQGGPGGMIQDEYLSFRAYQHDFLYPLAAAIFLSSLSLLVGVPLAIQFRIARPLNLLLEGVQAMNQGRLDLVIPVQANDEIGFLTNSFNNLSAELDNLIKGLETRVLERTSDLVAVNEQMRKLSVVIEQSPSTIVITDIDANIEYVNPAFTHSTGYTYEEVLGKNPRILKSNLTPPEVYEKMWHQLASGEAWRGELINKKKNGQNFWEFTLIAPILDSNGKITHYAAIKEDVTARVLAEQALRESEEQYRLLFDLESDAIFIVRNEDGQILEANTAATVLYGYARGELLSLKNTDLSAEPESTRQAASEQKPSDQVVVIPLRYHRKKDGSIFPVEITARFIVWKSQNVHIVTMRDITEHKKNEAELLKLATTDPLTGLANRRYFYTNAENIFKRAQPPSDNLAVMMLDIDHFKYINDTYGHAVGDMVLVQLGHRLTQNIRPTDIVARIGGEEFAILLPRTFPAEIETIADRILHVVGDQLFEMEHEKIHITFSMGIAEINDEIQDLDTLIRYADQALYKAKQSGRNKYVIWEKI